MHMHGLLLILLIFSFLSPQASMLMAAETLHAVEQSHERSINDRRSPPVKTVKIGVLAKRGKEQIRQKWGPTADYLTASIPDRSFEIVPLGFTEIHEAVREGRIDFVLANPAFYVELEKRHGVSRIATLINRNMPGRQTTTFGGVIFCRADRSDIRQLVDLKSRSFMAVEPRSFGGWIMAWREFKRIDIDPFTSFSSLQYGLTHDAVVYAVRDGKVDAGTVRSDTLERMAEAGSIRLDDFRILNRQPANSFPFMLSTDLYPEWPMAATHTTNNKLARQVASSLMAMEATHPAAIACKCAGWTVPLNYQPVHDCLLELRISPYEDFGKFTLLDVLVRYWRQITLMVLGIILIILTSLYILRLNRVLQQKKDEVDDLNRNLETKVLQRTEKIKTLLDQEIYLRAILRTVADVNELLVTSPNLETLLQDSCAKFAQHGHYGFCWIGLLQDDKLQEIFSSEQTLPVLEKMPCSISEPGGCLFSTPAIRCMTTNTTVISMFSREAPDIIPWCDDKKMSAFEGVITLPLRTDQQGDPFGVLAVYTWRPAGFEQEEVAMLEELAGDIGFAITSFKQREAVVKLEIERTANYEETILSFVLMIDHRDTYTAGHTQRVAYYCKLIAEEMGYSEEEIHILEKAAILHDIGKIATPDSVLLKPGTLSIQDYDLIKLHAFAGFEMLSKIEMYKELADIIHHHHERYDGKGYPDGLKGDEIPPFSRIITVADAFDAMTTNRIYKPRKEVPAALAELESLSGKQFHPAPVKAALKVLQDIETEHDINQLPKTELERRRFSYFFNDKLTGLFNEDYLQIILRNNQDNNDYKCLQILHMHNLQEYNKRQGWEQGNLLFKQFALELQATYPDTLIFRAYGKDFVVIAGEHFLIDGSSLKSFASIKETEIEIEVNHIDLVQNKIYTMSKLEKLELLASEG